MSWFIAHFPLNAIITNRTNITPCWSATKLFIEVIKEGIYIRSDESGGVDLQFKAWSARHIQKLSECYTISEADSGHKTLQWKTKRRKRLIKWIYLSFLLIYQRAQSKQNCLLLCASSLLFQVIHEKCVLQATGYHESILLKGSAWTVFGFSPEYIQNSQSTSLFSVQTIILCRCIWGNAR